MKGCWPFVLCVSSSLLSLLRAATSCLHSMGLSPANFVWKVGLPSQLFLSWSPLSVGDQSGKQTTLDILSRKEFISGKQLFYQTIRRAGGLKVRESYPLLSDLPLDFRARSFRWAICGKLPGNHCKTSYLLAAAWGTIMHSFCFLFSTHISSECLSLAGTNLNFTGKGFWKM